MFFCGDSWKLWRMSQPVQGEEMAASCLWVSGRKSPYCMAMLVTELGPSHPNAVSCIFFKMACKKLMKSIWQTSTWAFQVTLLIFWLGIHPNEKKKKNLEYSWVTLTSGQLQRAQVLCVQGDTWAWGAGYALKANRVPIQKMGFYQICSASDPGC